MAINDEELFSVLGLIYVLLRRETHRMIDVEWATVSTDYALEIIHLARDTKNPELHSLAARLEGIHPLIKRPQRVIPPAPPEPPTEAKYFKTLR
ncbi:MAG: hypothetical protein RL358_829 [Pseudomonadota bacterium]|jgi:hypothetical protein